jgi:hypothetical protein
MLRGYVGLENFLPEADVEAEGDQWLKAINGALQRDRLSTNEVKFALLTFKKDVVLNTWSGLLMDEDSLPDDWTNEGVLVGMR